MPTAEHAALMKRLGIPLNSKVQFVDMGRGTAPRKTGGWTDAQIRAKSPTELDAIVATHERAEHKLRADLYEQEKRASNPTTGWTEKQLCDPRNDAAKLAALARQALAAVTGLREALAAQQVRLTNIRMIRARRDELEE